MNIENTLQLLDIQEVTTKQQKKNGTREFKLPVNDPYGDAIHVASYDSGYVRRTRVRSCWQLNKTKQEKRYVEMKDYDTGRPVIRTFKDTVRILIEDEQERLEYLISFCLKNYYIGQSNMLSNGKFIPKWKHEYEMENFRGRYDELADAARLDYERERLNVSVNVNGQKYNII